MCSIVPYYVYQNLLEKGNEEQKSLAFEVLRSIKNLFAEKEAFLENLAKPTFTPMYVGDIKVNRSVYCAGNKMDLPGSLARSEGQKANKDKSVNKAYDGSGITWDFFYKMFGRNSIDNNGMELVSTVNFGRNYNNAFWNGSQMTYGNGDGKIFTTFLIIDVIGHEISHGVTERTAGLQYYRQSGALNESFSDVFGSCIKQYSLNQTAEQADWLVGEGIWGSSVDGIALRNMLNPGTAYDDERIGKDPQPDHMDKYIDTDNDNGGVHWNSGIFNRIFANTAIKLGGHSWEKAGKIWYHTLTTKLNKNSQFQDCANALVSSASELYGKNSKEQKTVIDCCKLVGIKPKF